MARRWRGPIVTENAQTGDGRVIAPGAVTWAELPLPLAWLRDGDQHITPGAAPQVGVIETITRVGDDLIGEGQIDDTEGTDGAELVRRMDAGLASGGSRQFLSIDPDDWAVEIVDTTGGSEAEDEGVLLLASAGVGPVPVRVTAAAGDPSPEGGDVLLEDAADSILERYTRMRIRGVTACAVSAFTTAWMELLPVDAVTAALPEEVEIPEHAFIDEDGDGFCDFCLLFDQAGTCEMRCGAIESVHEMEDEPAAPGPVPVVTAGGIRFTDFNINTTGTSSFNIARPREVEEVFAPPAAAFTLPEPEPGDEDDGTVYGMPVQDLLVEQPDGGLAVPFTTVERGGRYWAFGHAARWGQCHIGYPGQCVTAPESAAAYAHFHHGSVLCDDGTTVATGPLTMGTDHADAEVLASQARDHYAHTGLAFADVRASNGALGVWVSGVLRPGLTEMQRQVIRASSLSGDWRRVGAGLEFIGALAVNVPGFPIARELVAAAGLSQLPVAALAASAWTVDGVQRSLVASGIVQRCPDCQRRAMAARGYGAQLLEAQPAEEMLEALGLLRQIEARTRHLTPDAAEYALRMLRRS